MRLIDADKLMESLDPKESVWVGLVLSELIDNAPTVKAIPIEWLEWLLDTMGDGMYNLRAVIKDWERYKEDWGKKMRLIDKDRLLKGTNHYLMRLDEDSIALGDIESIDVRFVEMAEEVKAIPIEWIEKKLNCCDNINAEIFVKSLIRDWRKENGRS